MTLSWKQWLTYVAVPAVLALGFVTASAQGQLGMAVVTGSVRIDGQVASGSVPIGVVSRISTSKDSTLTLRLAKGGEVKITGQADMTITAGASGPHIQLICGEISVSSSVPASVVSQGGGLVEPQVGQATVSHAGKMKTVKKGKSKEFGDADVVMVPTADSVVVVKSRASCHCNC